MLSVLLDEKVQRILEVISGDEIAMAVTYPEAKEHDTFKEGKAAKNKEKRVHFQRHKVQALEVKSKIIQEFSGTLAGRGSSLHHWESQFHCFTSGGRPELCMFCLVFVFVVGMFFFGFVLSLVFPSFLDSQHSMHKDVIHPRLSPSSWWAQHRSKKKMAFACWGGLFLLFLLPGHPCVMSSWCAQQWSKKKIDAFWFLIRRCSIIFLLLCWMFLQFVWCIQLHDWKTLCPRPSKHSSSARQF